jgi:hypothetical protein
VRYIQHPETLELVPADEYIRPQREATRIMSDISPYQSVITGEMITSRSKHREHLKRHDCIEVGNEKPNWMKE